MKIEFLVHCFPFPVLVPLSRVWVSSILVLYNNKLYVVASVWYVLVYFVSYHYSSGICHHAAPRTAF